MMLDRSNSYSHLLDDPKDFSAQAADLFKSAPLVIRTLQRLRPAICPFDVLLQHIPQQGTVLDVGCGAGLLLGLAARARPDLHAIGIDSSIPAIHAAQTMAREHFADKRIHFEAKSAEGPFPAGAYNVVSMIDVLHHIPPEHQKSAILKCYDHVRPGGIFLYKDMARRPLLHAWWNRLHDIIVARQWIHYRAINDVENYLRGAGAVIIDRYAVRMGPYAHEMIVAQKLI